jgi:hypothetical protein
VERRLHHPALAQVERSAGHRQPVADERPELVVHPAFVELRRVRDQHLVRQTGTGDEIRAHRAEVDFDDFALTT